MQATIELPYKGKDYDFVVKLSTEAGYFEIIATHRQENRMSSITNHNRILSDICDGVIEIEDVEETYIDQLTFSEVHKLDDNARKCFKDVDWVENVLEPELDIDRAESEWSLVSAE